MKEDNFLWHCNEAIPSFLQIMINQDQHDGNMVKRTGHLYACTPQVFRKIPGKHAAKQ